MTINQSKQKSHEVCNSLVDQMKLKKQ